MTIIPNIVQFQILKSTRYHPWNNLTINPIINKSNNNHHRDKVILELHQDDKLIFIILDQMLIDRCLQKSDHSLCSLNNKTIRISTTNSIKKHNTNVSMKIISKCNFVKNNQHNKNKFNMKRF